MTADLRAIAAAIRTADDLERALSGLSWRERPAMLNALKPYLSAELVSNE